MSNRWKTPIHLEYWNNLIPYEDKVAVLNSNTKQDLVRAMVDYQYNSFCRAMEDQVLATHPSGKVIPYIGSFWRDIEWSTSLGLCRTTVDTSRHAQPSDSNTNVHIGRVLEDSNEPPEQGPPFIGFMANNKWGYPERTLTVEERVHVIFLLDTAMLSDNKVVKASTLQHLWEYMQTLSVEYEKGSLTLPCGRSHAALH